MDVEATNPPLRRPPASALAINLAVISAVLLRDIKVRAGAYYTGFLIILSMPIVHLLVVVAMFKIFGRIAPVGNDQTIYFGLSILPFVIFVYPSRQIVIALGANRPLLYFNRVKVFDIFFARAILEMATSIVVVIILILILASYSDGFSPRDWGGFVFAVAATIYLSFSIGVANGLIAHVVPAWHIIFNVTAPIFWAASGILFFPSAIPDPYDHWLAWNPLLQCIEWIRYSYYEDYPDKVLNVPFLLGFATANLAISLFAEKISRKVLLSK